MATIEEILVERLEGFSALASLVGKRIFAVAAPQDVKKPFLVFTRIAGPRAKNSTGPSYTAMPRIQIDCYAPQYGICKGVAEQVRLALDGWRDMTAELAVKGSSLQGDREFWEPGTDPRLYRISMDFLITHDESKT